MLYFYCIHINIYLHSYVQKNNILENLICLLIPSTKGTKVSPENFGFPPQKPSSVFPTQIHLFPGTFFLLLYSYTFTILQNTCFVQNQIVVKKKCICVCMVLCICIYKVSCICLCMITTNYKLIMRLSVFEAARAQPELQLLGELSSATLVVL